MLLTNSHTISDQVMTIYTSDTSFLDVVRFHLHVVLRSILLCGFSLSVRPITLRKNEKKLVKDKVVFVMHV